VPEGQSRLQTLEKLAVNLSMLLLLLGKFFKGVFQRRSEFKEECFETLDACLPNAAHVLSTWGVEMPGQRLMAVFAQNEFLCGFQKIMGNDFVLPISEYIADGHPRLAANLAKAAKNFFIVNSEVASNRIAFVLKHTKSKTYPFVMRHARPV